MQDRHFRVSTPSYIDIPRKIWVNAGMSVYLFTHPDVNDFFTSLKGMSREEMRTAITDYAQANPQVQSEIQAIRQPAADFRDRCDAPIPDMPLG